MKQLKKMTFKSVMFMLAAMIFPVLFSCNVEDIIGGTGDSGSGGLSADDPDGTVVMNLSNDGSDRIRVFNGYYSGNDYVEFGINGSNNFVVRSGSGCQFVCVGSVAGLSAIVASDTLSNGYSTTCAAMPGYGYILRSNQLVRSADSTKAFGYVRIYVDSWIKNTAGVIIGATVKYQDNWIILENASLTGDSLHGNDSLTVSTIPTTKNVLIEQFTGNLAGYDPDGHKMLNDIMVANPGKVFGINIHTGPYANGKYTTNYGSALASQSDLIGFPSGTVNRHLFSGMSQGNGTVMHRNHYATATNQILAETSCANIAANATINRSTRELTVNVVVYYTSSANGATNKINVALLQDSIWGSQAGAQTYNPAYYNAATDMYCHMHMLRHLVTGQWGDDIVPVVGRQIRKTYNYTIPAQISSENVVLNHLKILVFLAEGQQEIITVCNAPITFR